MARKIQSPRTNTANRDSQKKGDAMATTIPRASLGYERELHSSSLALSLSVKNFWQNEVLGFSLFWCEFRRFGSLVEDTARVFWEAAHFNLNWGGSLLDGAAAGVGFGQLRLIVLRVSLAFSSPPGEKTLHSWGDGQQEGLRGPRHNLTSHHPPGLNDFPRCPNGRGQGSV